MCDVVTEVIGGPGCSWLHEKPCSQEQVLRGGLLLICFAELIVKQSLRDDSVYSSSHGRKRVYDTRADLRPGLFLPRLTGKLVQRCNLWSMPVCLFVEVSPSVSVSLSLFLSVCLSLSLSPLSLSLSLSLPPPPLPPSVSAQHTLILPCGKPGGKEAAVESGGRGRPASHHDSRQCREDRAAVRQQTERCRLCRTGHGVTGCQQIHVQVERLILQTES